MVYQFEGGIEDDLTEQEIDDMPPYLTGLYKIYFDSSIVGWMGFQYEVYEWVSKYGREFMNKRGCE